MSYPDALRKAREHIKAHTRDEPNYEEDEVDIALWGVETAADYIDMEHTYTLAELRGSWPYSEDARFLMVSDESDAVERWAGSEPILPGHTRTTFPARYPDEPAIVETNPPNDTVSASAAAIARVEEVMRLR